MNPFQKEIAINDMGLHDLNPLTYGEERCLPGHSFGPAIRRYYLMHFVLSGCGILETQDRIYKIHKNQAFLIRPNEITTYHADTEAPWHYIWVGFNGELCHLLDQEKKTIFNITPPIISKLQLCEKIDDVRELYLASVLFDLFTSILKNSIHPSPVKSAKNYIDLRYMYQISVESIAKMLNLDRRYLSRIFKETYGITMQEYIIQLRISEAKKLLQSNYSVTETANMVGYKDAFLFSKLFKKYTGMCPKAFATYSKETRKPI